MLNQRGDIENPVIRTLPTNQKTQKNGLSPSFSGRKRSPPIQFHCSTLPERKMVLEMKIPNIPPPPPIPCQGRGRVLTSCFLWLFRLFRKESLNMQIRCLWSPHPGRRSRCSVFLSKRSEGDSNLSRKPPKSWGHFVGKKDEKTWETETPPIPV